MIRILFAATPEIALPCLRALSQDPLFQVGVLTNPDAPVGRSREPVASPVKTLGLELGLEVFSPPRLDSEFRSLQEGRWDLLVSFAYGKIFGPKFLGLFPQGGLNVHPSLLPRWRGPSPLNAALVAGDPVTGLTVQTLALEMDAGDIVYQETWELKGEETAGTLGDQAALRAAAVLPEVLKGFSTGTLLPRPQGDEGVTYCRLLAKEDGQVDWSLSALEIHRRIRGLNPWPGAYTFLQGQKLTLWEAKILPSTGEIPRLGETSRPGEIIDLDKKEGILVQTGQGILALRQVQLASKKSMDHRSFANGQPGLPGTLLG